MKRAPRPTWFTVVAYVVAAVATMNGCANLELPPEQFQCNVPGQCRDSGEPPPDASSTDDVASKDVVAAPVCKPANCDDGVACTVDTCAADGVCTHVAKVDSCVDKIACTKDFCDPASGCIHVPTTAVCDDNNACTHELCDLELGCQKIALSCNDGNFCTDDICNSAGKCDNSYACDDGKLCTVDTCVPSTGCQHKPVVCKANSSDCIGSVCVEGKGCVAAGHTCDDGDPCTADACLGKKCVNKSICDDNNECTFDKCTQSGGCTHTKKSCPDGVGCLAGTCSVTSGCTLYGSNAKCNDNSVCTSDSCDSSGKCNYSPLGGICDAKSDYCSSRTCQAGKCEQTTSATVLTSAGTTAGSGGNYTASVKFHTLGGIAYFTSKIFVTDTKNNRVFYYGTHNYSKNGAFVTSYGGAGEGKAGYVDGGPGVGLMDGPVGVDYGYESTTKMWWIYVADRDNHRIRTIRRTSPDSGKIGTIVGSGGVGSGQGALVNGPVASARLSSPHDVDHHSSALYIADTGNHQVRKFDYKTQTVTTYAGSTSGYADGPVASAKFNQPKGIAVRNSFTVYVSDTGNHRIRRIDYSKNVVTVAGDGTPGSSNGIGTISRFDAPSGLAWDHNGLSLLVADSANHRIRRVSEKGFVSTVLGSSGPGYKDGALANAQVKFPIGVAVSGSRFWIADQGNVRVREVRMTGLQCDDGDPCTLDSCVKTSSLCKHNSAPNDTSCGAGGVCKAGACVVK